ncbi:MAG: hypothetical protein GIW99_00215 [Candidatus Eremiobacteraeota bacterium]|nr:hypothetical protein [Candidatus Eremiobacteraeota bacterium]MBC5826111.1 hypothetical protein [Candidatus Eremiobacteraeota bacterium]
MCSRSLSILAALFFGGYWGQQVGVLLRVGAVAPEFLGGKWEETQALLWRVGPGVGVW